MQASQKTASDRSCRESGFTLMEALVALIIIIAMTAILYRGLSSGLRLSDVADRSQDALLVAKSRLAALGVETPLQSEMISGHDGNHVWQATLKPYVAADQSDRLSGFNAYWASVTVSWHDPRRSAPQTLMLSTVKIKPAE